jgi:hypothetical protein
MGRSVNWDWDRGGKRKETHDEHGDGDAAVVEVGLSLSLISPAADDVDEEEGVGRVERDLQHRVDHHEDGTVVRVPLREVAPDEDHRDAARHAHHDHAGAVGREVRERRPCQAEHYQRPDDPVEEEGDENVCEDPAGAEELREALVLDFGEHGPHLNQNAFNNHIQWSGKYCEDHDDQAYCNGWCGCK